MFLLKRASKYPFSNLINSIAGWVIIIAKNAELVVYNLFITTGFAVFAVCPWHTAKTERTVCYTWQRAHGKEQPAKPGLPCALSRAHGKHFAVHWIWHMIK